MGKGEIQNYSSSRTEEETGNTTMRIIKFVLFTVN